MYKFIHRYDNVTTEHAIDEMDMMLPDLIEEFSRFLVSCTFSKESVDAELYSEVPGTMYQIMWFDGLPFGREEAGDLYSTHKAAVEAIKQDKDIVRVGDGVYISEDGESYSVRPVKVKG